MGGFTLESAQCPRGEVKCDQFCPAAHSSRGVGTSVLALDLAGLAVGLITLDSALGPDVARRGVYGQFVSHESWSNYVRRPADLFSQKRRLVPALPGVTGSGRPWRSLGYFS